MNKADNQLYRSDKVMKRGLIGKDHSPLLEITSKEHGSSPTFLSLDPSAKLGRSWHGEHWKPRRYILVIFALVSIVALAASFLFACSMSRTPFLDNNNSALYHTGLPLEIEPLIRSSSSSSALGCNANEAVLRVFMYDLEPEFHYGMLPEREPPSQTWPKEIPPYPGGLYQQHSPEYWLTSDLLTSNMADRQSPCTAYRVDDWRSADVIFVPFFASLSYNKFTRPELKNASDKNRELQEKLMRFLRWQAAWVASGGADHVIVIHHPNSMHVIRGHLRNAMFVVADFGRYDSAVANIGKDVVAPYKHVVQGFTEDDTTDFESRKTLLFFQGAIIRKEGGIIRQQLYDLLKDEPGVHFEAGNTTSAAIRSATAGMQGSKFCLNLAGDTPSSNRLFDSIASHCVPVIISDNIELPFEDDLDYTTFCLFVKSSDALKSSFVINLLRGVNRDEWTKMRRRMQEVDHHFKYQHPTKPDDAVHMTWKAIARKMFKVRLQLNRQRRYRMASLKLKNS